jgi:hypothetical protein
MCGVDALWWALTTATPDDDDNDDDAENECTHSVDFSIITTSSFFPSKIDIPTSALQIQSYPIQACRYDWPYFLTVSLSLTDLAPSMHMCKHTVPEHA